MKGYLVRITPLILLDWAAFLRYSAMCACLSTGLRRVRASPRAVEAQGLLRSRAGSPGGGQSGVSGNKKGTSPLRRGAWLAILNASSRSLLLLAGCSVFCSAPSARG